MSTFFNKAYHCSTKRPKGQKTEDQKDQNGQKEKRKKMQKKKIFRAHLDSNLQSYIRRRGALTDYTICSDCFKLIL